MAYVLIVVTCSTNTSNVRLFLSWDALYWYVHKYSLYVCCPLKNIYTHVCLVDNCRGCLICSCQFIPLLCNRLISVKVPNLGYFYRISYTSEGGPTMVTYLKWLTLVKVPNHGYFSRKVDTGEGARPWLLLWNDNIQPLWFYWLSSIITHLISSIFFTAIFIFFAFK